MRHLSRLAVSGVTILLSLGVLSVVAPAQAAQSGPNCGHPTSCAKYVNRVGTPTAVQAPPAVAGVPPTLTASFTDRMDYPKLGPLGIPLSNKVYLNLQSFGGLNGVPAHLCAANQPQTTIAIEHTFDFQPGPVSFNATVGPVTGGYVAGPRTVKVPTGDLKGCGAYYNVDIELTLSPGFVGMTHTMQVTSKLPGGVVTTTGISEYVPFNQI